MYQYLEKEKLSTISRQYNYSRGMFISEGGWGRGKDC